MSDEASQVKEFPRASDTPESIAARNACIDDIRQHLETNGPRDWKLVQARHPTIPDRRFWRYVQQVRGTGAQSKCYTPDPDALRQSIQLLANRAQTAETKSHIPRPPPPAVIAAGGVEARRKLDFLTHLDGMLQDCDRLREWAMRLDEKTGEMRISNPLYFTQSIKLRADVLNTAISAMRALWDIQRMQTFYDLIVAEVTKLDPETGRRVMEKLQELDNERGMTMNARI